MSAAGGFPDWQRITQWFGNSLATETGHLLGAGQLVVGPLNVRSFASIVVWIKPTGGQVTVTVTQQVPDGPASLVTQSSFVVNAGNVIAEAFVLLAGDATVTFQGAIAGTTIDYAIVPANTNVNAEVAALTQLGFQHNDAVIATETAIDLEDAAPIGWTFVDDPANLRVKITPTLRQNGAVTGSLYRWDGAAWTPTAGIIADDANRQIVFGGDTNIYRKGAGLLATDVSFYIYNAGGDANPAMRLIRNGANPRIDFGPGGAGAIDTNLYRSFAAVVKTDGGFRAGASIIANHTLAGQIDLNADGSIYFGSAADLRVYRSGAAALRVANDLYTTGLINLDVGGTGSKLYFGAAADTNLVRSAVGVLDVGAAGTADGTFRVRRLQLVRAADLALAATAITVTGGIHRITATDGTTLQTINGGADGAILILFNATAGAIPVGALGNLHGSAANIVANGLHLYVFNSADSLWHLITSNA